MIRLILIFLLLQLFGCQQNETPKLRIATAANMQFAMKELTQVFSSKYGIECEVVVSSSGKLTAQIKEGAPYDIFVSANMKYPRQLFKDGLTNEPSIYAYGKLVLWTMKPGIKPSLDLLISNEISHIAIANAKTAPYGLAAEEVLKYNKIFKGVKDKLVYGESISQANQFILSNAAEIGFTSKSVVISPKMKGKGQWKEISSDQYSPIEQSVVIIQNNNKTREEAGNFYRFLFSPEAGTILQNYGYIPKQNEHTGR